MTLHRSEDILQANMKKPQMKHGAAVRPQREAQRL